MISLVIFLVIRHRNKQPASKETALASLDRQFANGEISKEEYLERKNLIKD